MHLPNTIRYPRTMMVKLFNTAITCGTVLRTKRTDNLVKKTYQLFVIPHYVNQSSKEKADYSWYRTRRKHLASWTEQRPIASQQSRIANFNLYQGFLESKIKFKNFKNFNKA